MVFMFLMVFGMAAWFLADGYVVWPAEAKRHGELKQLAAELIEQGDAEALEDEAVTRAWERYAEEVGYSTKVPKDRTASDLAQQRGIGGVMMTGALIFAAWVGWNHTRSVRAEGDLVTGASGEQVHLDTIVEMDRRKWANKGIAYAVYEKDGKRRRLTLDDHKFLGCEEIILEAERRIAARAGGGGAVAEDGTEAGSPTQTEAPKEKSEQV